MWQGQDQASEVREAWVRYPVWHLSASFPQAASRGGLGALGKARSLYNSLSNLNEGLLWKHVLE